jgi:hypothetical protein
LGRKRKRARGLSAKRPSSSFEQTRDRGEGSTERPVRPASVIVDALGSAAAGDRGKTERRTRASYPGSHLGRGRPVEAALWRGTGGSGG